MELPPKAILFDLDGTLLDSESVIDDCWRAALAAACRSAEIDPGELFDAMDRTRRLFWVDDARAVAGRMDFREADRTIMREAVARLRPDLPALADAVSEDYWTRRTAALRLFPGAMDILVTLRRRGVRTALVSNGSAETQRAKLLRFELEPWFDCIVISGEFGVSKPDERVFRYALDSVGVPPSESWMVGNDLDADIAAPHRLGLHTVWVDGAGAGVPATSRVAPHRVIRQVGQLLD